MIIVDVDFRKVKRWTTINDLPEQVEVLQWRKNAVIGNLDEDGKSKPICKWTDWQDVRTEEE